MQAEFDDLAFSPSFNCYFSDSLTATAAAKVSRELEQEHAAQFHEFSDVDEEVFDFSMEFAGEEVSRRQIDLKLPQFVFPIFNTELLTEDKVDLAVEEIDSTSSVTIQFQKLDEFSLLEANESEGKVSGTFCLWWSKADVGVTSPLTKCKKISSTRSGSRLTWIIRNLLRWRNNQGKESIFLLRSKKFRASKQIRNVDSEEEEVTKVAGN